MAQCVSNQTHFADEKGRCKLKNHIEIDSKSGPNAERVEDSAWIESLGSPPNVASMNDLEETEQSGQPRDDVVFAHRAHGQPQKDHTSTHHDHGLPWNNDATITLQSHSIEELEEKKSQLPHSWKLAA